MSEKPQICLILDNPLRDLDGMVLLAWQLAQQGVDAWLVPMYDQAWDVRAIGADFVLLNYLRNNNRDHALAYLREGMRVGVLDTEGLSGKSPEEYAAWVAVTGIASLMDLYCVWGQGQLQALRTQNIIPEERLKLTGCPRYDYCAPPWSTTLPMPDMAPGYVLINTNFPYTNSRFSQAADNEMRALSRLGIDAELATNYLRDEKIACKEMVELIRHLVTRFPYQQFVLRPHPFESTAHYEQEIQAPNFMVRQEGTSIQWIHHARALIQLNCLTAIEAAAFGVPALSPTWFNTPALSVPLSLQLSRSFANEAALTTQLAQLLAMPKGAHSGDHQAAIAEYLLSDGHAAERVATVIQEALSSTRSRPTIPPSSLRFCALQAACRVLGYRLYDFAQQKLRGAALHARRKQKLFSIEQVTHIVQRIEQASGMIERVQVHPMRARPLEHSRLASGNAICFSRSDTH